MKTNLLTHLPSVAVKATTRGLFGLSLGLTAATSANAALTFTFTEVGPDVVFTTAGSINTTGLFLDGVENLPGFYVASPSGFQANAGQPGSIQFDHYVEGGFAYPPASYDGATNISLAPEVGGVYSAGYNFQSDGFFHLFLPHNYVSNAPIAPGFATFAGQSFASLGLVDGASTVFNLPNDVVTINVGAAAIPEPSAWIAMIGAMGLVGFVGYRRFRKSSLKEKTVA